LQFDLDEILVMVSKTPPHKNKDDVTNEMHRVNMVKLAIEPYSYLKYSDFELKREGNIYTADTLTMLKEQHPSDHYFFIIGGDSLINLDKWYHPEVILEKCTLIAALREGVSNNEFNEKTLSLNEKYLSYDPDIRTLYTNPIDVSSTDIRTNIRKNIDLAQFLPDKVYKYIIDNKLYN